MSAAQLPDIPFEIIVDILSRLPVKSLLRFMSVCKQWCVLISEPKFVKTHLNRAKEDNDYKLRRHIVMTTSAFSIDYQTLDRVELNLPFVSSCLNAEVLASCNGLLLVGVGGRTYFLWNPSTRLYKRILGPHHYKDCCMLYGLGFDSSINGFKIVRVIRVVSSRNYVNFGPLDPRNNYDATHVKVYNCKTDSWRKIEDFPYKIFTNGQGVTVNGTPHWVVCRDTIIDYVIIYFDLGEEKFKEVPKPNWLIENSKFNFGVFGGSLCFVRYQERDIEVWVMEEYGVKESWSNLFVVPKGNMCIPHLVQESWTNWFDVPKRNTCIRHLVPLCFTKDGKVMLETDQIFLTVYNLKECSFKNIMSFNNPDGFKTAAYVESLVSPSGESETLE